MGHLNPVLQGASNEPQRKTVGNAEITSLLARSRRNRPDKHRARKRIRVLLIEDNPLDAELVREKLLDLPECHFELTCAGRLDSGLSALGTGAFDALLTDLSLPDATPWQTLEEMQRRTESVAVLILSGRDDPSLRREALDVGAQAFLGKDTDGSELGRHLLAAVDRHRAQRTQLQLERWIASSPDAVIVTSERGHVKFVNDRAVELFGRSKEELLRERFRFSLKAGSASEIQILRGAEQRSVELSVVPVGWQGAPALVASFRDNTERRRAEAQLAAADRLASLGALVTSVAHDINNPLAAMIFNLELAAQAALAHPGLEELQQLIADAREAAGHVRAVVRDLRICARAPEEHNEATDIRRVVDTALRMTNNQTRHRARLVVALDEVPEVRANESRVGQVLLNLLVNAAQAIPEGAAEDNCISVSARRREDWVEIAVSDTGCGMSPAVQNRLFTPFFTSKPADQGTGLGLSICQRIVESYGGKMEVESRVGVGSTFRVLLPVQMEPATLRPAPALVVRESHRRGRILVIDDDVMVGNALARAMTSEHAVQVVRSAQEGLTTLRVDSNFDVVLCDVMMPEMTGTELFERLEREMPEVVKRFVFFTGGAFTPRTRELLARLPNRKLDKPIDVDVLSALIAELVDCRP